MSYNALDGKVDTTMMFAHLFCLESDESENSESEIDPWRVDPIRSINVHVSSRGKLSAMYVVYLSQHLVMGLAGNAKLTERPKRDGGWNEFSAGVTFELKI